MTDETRPFHAWEVPSPGTIRALEISLARLEEEAQRRVTRNITLLGIALAAFVGLANLLPGILS